MSRARWKSFGENILTCLYWMERRWNLYVTVILIPNYWYGNLHFLLFIDPILKSLSKMCRGDLLTYNTWTKTRVEVPSLRRHLYHFIGLVSSCIVRKFICGVNSDQQNQESLEKIFLFHKFQEKNLNLNRDSNSNLQISSLALCRWAILVLITIPLQSLLLKCYFLLGCTIYGTTCHLLIIKRTNFTVKYDALH